MNKTEIENKVNLSIIRYSQCWEDTEILLEGLKIKENDICLSIGSAGDNSFSLLTKNPKKVYRLDLNKTQVAVIELKKIMYKELNYSEFINFIGIENMNVSNRVEIYEKYKNHLTQESEEYWNKNIRLIEKGVIHSGKFENFFKIFREKVLPLVHSRKRIDELLTEKTKEERIKFYDKKWNNIRMKLMFKIFLNRKSVGKNGRDPEFFKYVGREKSFSEYIKGRVKVALVDLDPSKNEYLYYIAKGYYKKEKPFAYREENFELIKKNIDKIVIVSKTIEEFMENLDFKIDKYNLSDIFEYMSYGNYIKLYSEIIKNSSENARICYWNLMVSRKNPIEFRDKIEYLEKESKELHYRDKTFFYSDFVIEQKRG